MKIILTLLFSLFSFLSFAQNDLVKRDNPRQFMNDKSCNAFYTPFEPEALIPLNDGSGIRITNADVVDNFKTEAQRLFDQYGEDYFYEGIFNLTGIDMQDAKATKIKYLTYLEELGLDSSRIDLRVMSFPFAKVTGIDKKSLIALKNLITYNLQVPNKVRDMQKVYFKQKTLKALQSAAYIETLGLAMLAINDNLSLTERGALIAANIALFYIYSRNIESWLNWLFRPGSNKVVGFVKQVSMSVPFIVAYNLFGNITDISEFVAQSGLAQVLPALGPELAIILPFALKTAVLAGLWHRFVNTDILGGWYNAQKSLGNIKEIKAFKTMEKVRRALGIPFSVMFLFSALPTAAEVFRVGEGAIGSFNSGHLQMLAFTAATVATFKIYKKVTGVNLMDKINNTPSLPKLLKIWRRQLQKAMNRLGNKRARNP